MTPTREYYESLITSEYRLAPKFKKMVGEMTRYGVATDTASESFLKSFDVDTAEGDQLDMLGEIVGISRTLDFEPPEGSTLDIICPNATEMKADSDPSIYKIYQMPTPAQMANTGVVLSVIMTGGEAADVSGVFRVNDDTYRKMVKSRIIQNIWRGDPRTLYEMWETLYPGGSIQIQDLQDMTYNVVIIGDFSVLEVELIKRGILIPKPEGVRVYIVTVVGTDGIPIFSYNFHTEQFSGYRGWWTTGTN